MFDSGFTPESAGPGQPAHASVRDDEPPAMEWIGGS
jgi:hypothetical protein